MSIRIIPQDELGSSEKRTADYIPPLLFPRLKNLYNRRAERLRELAENNPLGDFLRFAALVAHAQEVVLYDHPLQMDLTAAHQRSQRAGQAAAGHSRPAARQALAKAAAFADCRAEAGDERHRAGGH
ncbi:formate dehydrogenase accessory protein FdhE [Enterobacter asburiae]|uniref:Formate dehydrogenase accessory protein FdhE n=1 Tax=Enterobacter asburiae TaxID=61645 RepID=A0A376FE59_ENTAS|nr:formate dehydrogenase accessory protein FdhE [Enterobacter asburiae]